MKETVNFDLHVQITFPGGFRDPELDAAYGFGKVLEHFALTEEQKVRVLKYLLDRAESRKPGGGEE